MQRFNPEKELNKIQNHENNNTLKTVILMVPVLVFVFCATAYITSSYSTPNASNGKKYTIKIDIINGEENTYIKQINGGSFEDTIASSATFGSINCSQGNLLFDEENNKVYSYNIKEDTTCIISFMDDGNKEINYSELGQIKDNYGTSYYYKADANNNYFKYNNDLYRIVRINGDGTLRIMLIENIADSNYGKTNQYENSNAKKIIDSWYSSKHFNDSDIINGDFDANNYNYENVNLADIKSFIRNYYYNVGLLSVKEVKLINSNSASSYIPDNSLLINGYDLYDVWTSSGKINRESLAEIHPVLNIKYSSLKGQGTINIPYEIEE